MAYILVEVACGFWSNSLALLADAGHNLSDVLGLLLAWGANLLAQRRPTSRYTYGMRSSTILAALLNAVILLMAVGGIVWEAIRRFSSEYQIPGDVVMITAAIGVVINFATAMLFVSGRKSDLNLRGAFLHMLADAVVSAGVVVAGGIILWTGAVWVDSVVSLVVAGVIFGGTWQLLTDSLDLALHAVPRGIKLVEVEAYFNELDGVNEVHDLHVWAMSTSETALTVHLVIPDGCPSDDWLQRVSRDLEERFGVGHATLQVERGSSAEQCRLADPNHV